MQLPVSVAYPSTQVRTLLGGRFDLNSECCSCQEEAEGEAKQAFPEINLHLNAAWLFEEGQRSLGSGSVQTEPLPKFGTA